MSEKLKFAEHELPIDELYEKASDITRQRLMLYRMGVQPKNIPLGGEKTAQKIMELIYQSKLGFALTQRTENYHLNNLRGFLQATNEVVDRESVSSMISELIQEQPLDKTHSGPLIAFNHAMATIGYLRSLDNVTFANLSETNDHSLKGGEMTHSFWKMMPLDEVSIWNFLNSLDNTTYGILFNDKMPGQGSCTKASHFFTGGAEMIKSIQKYLH
jgi:hypothetical protein